jgi:hypothetical protein
MPGSCQILSVLGGSCTLAWPGGTIRLALGDTVVLPAALADCQVSGEARIARSYVPEPDDAGLRAWRAAQPAAYEADDVSDHQAARAPMATASPQVE